jgi:DNA polymerase-3 subunit epsilon
MTLQLKRQLVVVDLETTGLHSTAWPLEVAAINVDTGEELQFVPYVTDTALGNADRKALQINRYYERGVWEEMLDEDATKEKWDLLRKMLDGNTLGGSNPRFDAGIMSRFIGEPWHHRLADLSAYAAGRFGLNPNQLPGLADVCARLDITNHEEHSAYYDAIATAECFKALMRR